MDEQPAWKLVAQIGDVNPFEEGGIFVYTDTTGKYSPKIEYLKIYDGVLFRVYSFDIGKCKVDDTGKITGWFNTVDVASFVGLSNGELINQLCSDDIIDRASAYRDIASYYGYDNFDGNPLNFSREEVEKRYSESW